MRKKRINLVLAMLAFVITLTGCNGGKKSVQVSGLNDQEEKLILEYLQSNHSAVDTEDDSTFTDLAILNSDLEGKEIFFTGEYHGVKANNTLRMKFLKYFKEKTDFKYYLCELGYSHAYFINKYLDTGDIKILEGMYKSLKGTYEWNKDNYNHWKKLYEYNKTLPEDKRIKIVGVDLEHQVDNAYRYLVDVLPEKEIPLEIRENINKIESILTNFNRDRAHKHSVELLKDMEKKDSIYKEYLGEDFTGFKLVNQNVLNTFELNKMKNEDDWNNTRDRFIYENFKVIHNELPKGRYYGQWGLNHTYQSKEKNIIWFGAHLNDEKSELKDKILTIAYIYDDCKQMGKRKNNKYSVDKMNTISIPIKKSNDNIGGNVNIYKLTGEGSPFFQLPLHNVLKSIDTETNAAEFYQYIVCIKNSEATEPLNDEY